MLLSLQAEMAHKAPRMPTVPDPICLANESLYALHRLQPWAPGDPLPAAMDDAVNDAEEDKEDDEEVDVEELDSKA